MYAFLAQPYVRRLQPTHSAEITPYCFSTPPFSVTGTVRNHSLAASTPTKSENECTHLLWWEQSESVGEEKETWQVFRRAESLQLTNINTTHHEYFMKHVPYTAAMLSCAGCCLFSVSESFFIPELCFIIIFHISERPQVPKVAYLFFFFPEACGSV